MTVGIVVLFVPEDESIVFHPSRPSKSECIVIGMNYYNATGAPADTQHAMLEEHGGILVRRSLRAFANYAKRTGQPKVAKFAELLRNDIQLARGEEDDDAA
jgi:hypothetical protein